MNNNEGQPAYFANEVFSGIYNALIEDGVLSSYCDCESSLLPSHVALRFIEDTYLSLLRRLWERVLIVELNQADRDGLLLGETEEKRFNYFVKNFAADNNIRCIYQKYPDLELTWAKQRVSQASSIKLFFKRLAADIENVARRFHGDADIRITSLKKVGDPHRGMQCTARVEYVNRRNDKRVVFYKPRDLTIDEGFSQFVKWWNQNHSISHIAPRVINSGVYGWVGAVAREECNVSSQLEDYYRRYGSLIALAYVFGAVDLHMENIVNHCEYPVIVDLETLFSCVPARRTLDPKVHHFYSSLLLPTQDIENQIEISPLSANSNEKTTLETSINPQRRSSSLKMEKVPFVMESPPSEVKLSGRRIEFLEYDNHIIEGCRETLSLIALKKEAFRKAIAEAFKDAVVRVVFRGTSDYAKILYNMYHPLSLHSRESVRDVNSLNDGLCDLDIVSSEMKELLDGDVPYFEIAFAGHVIVDGKGRSLKTSIAYSPRQKFEFQLSGLSDRFIEEIVMDIEGAFLVHRLRKGLTVCRPVDQLDQHKAQADFQTNEDWFNDYACVALDTIRKNVRVCDDIHYWTCIDVVPENVIRAGVSGIDVYSGISGIALAFHIVGDRSSRADFVAFSKMLCRQIMRQLDAIPHAKLGAYSGTSGTLWALSFINQDEPVAILATVESELKKLTYALMATEYNSYLKLDIISGVAGTIMMLIRMHRLLRLFPLADHIRRIIDSAFRLLKEKSASLLSNDTLLGFAHGTAGVSAALANYMRCFDCFDQDAIKIIEDNVARETSLRRSNGWPHLGNDICNTSWCHGTNGFGFSRHFIRPFTSQKRYDEDMDIIQGRLGERQTSLSLCHGMAADYYLARRLELDDTRILAQLRQEMEVSGVRTDFGLNRYEMVGAMNGVAGLFVGDELL